MAKQSEVYKCMACGNIVVVVHGGGGELVCCGEPMKNMVENTVDAAKEKHVPVIERSTAATRSRSAAWPIP
jgi:superoxide reductase